jgi:hypothetical protein
MSDEQNRDNLAATEGPQFSAEVPTEKIEGWTEIEPGRFMPRRVRGSFQGRALG